MYLISLISDAKYVIIQIQEKYTEFRNRRHKDHIKSCCTLKKPLRLCKVISTLVNCVNRKPIEVMFVPQVTALYSLARSFQQASNECISSPSYSFRSIMHRSTVFIKGNIILIRREKKSVVELTYILINVFILFLIAFFLNWHIVIGSGPRFLLKELVIIRYMTLFVRRRGYESRIGT